ncbi:hypothetical protein IMY05_C2442000200 [Salix suchowensis]|nr:hypothetical protein IMY05_C2442000200 [Salix suchowensis]
MAREPGMKPTIRRSNQTGHIQHQGDRRQERRRAGGLAFAHVLIRALVDLEHRPAAAIHNHQLSSTNCIVRSSSRRALTPKQNHRNRQDPVQIIAAHDMEVQRGRSRSRSRKGQRLTLKRQLEANRQRHPLPRFSQPTPSTSQRSQPSATNPTTNPSDPPAPRQPTLRLLNNRNLQPRILVSRPPRIYVHHSHQGDGISLSVLGRAALIVAEAREMYVDLTMKRTHSRIVEHAEAKDDCGHTKGCAIEAEGSESSTVRKEFLDECRRLFKKTLKVKNDADYAYYEGATAEEINSWVANQGPGPSEENLKLDMEGGVGSEWNAEVMHILMDKLRKYCLANKVLKKILGKTGT